MDHAQAKEILDLCFSGIPEEINKGIDLRDSSITSLGNILYRYRSLGPKCPGMAPLAACTLRDDWVFGGIQKNEVPFSSPPNFNDPFDSMPSLYLDPIILDKPAIVSKFNLGSVFTPPELDSVLTFGELADLLEKKNPKGFASKITELKILQQNNSRTIIDEYYSNIKFCCFAESNKNVAMWYHYANDFAGICIGYDFAGQTQKESVLPVCYVKSLPTIHDGSVLAKRYKEWFKTRDNQILKEIRNGIPFYKLDDWDYEDEWRSAGNYLGNSPFFNTSFPIKSIFMGSKITQENEDYLRLIINGRNIALFKMKINHTGIDFEPA
jgi:hypothetical protein